jgi:hypothetical protein
MNNVWTEHCATLRQQIETLTAEREQYKVAWQKAEIEVHDLTAQLKQAREALEKYGRHTLECTYIEGDDKCTCGFTAELAQQPEQPRTAGEQTSKEKEL